jgi:5-methylcytosine-specific restriction endonuclease McrA
MSSSTKRRVVGALIARYGDRCWYCGGSFGEGCRARTIDHVVAWSQGGTNALANLRLACVACNQAKGVGAPLVAVHGMAETASRVS